MIKFLIIFLFPLALLAPAPSQHEIMSEMTEEERQEAGENAMWMVAGLTDVIFEVKEIR